MTSLPKQLTVKCPKCGKVYRGWYRPSVNLSIGDFTEDDLEEAMTVCCPDCGHRVSPGGLVVREGDNWSFDDYDIDDCCFDEDDPDFPPGSLILTTRGGPKKAVIFQVVYDDDMCSLVIRNTNGARHEFNLYEIMLVLRKLLEDFGSGPFPLANNVETMGQGTEQAGLGMTILSQRPGDVTHAQGASYLGPVLEHCRFLEWNGKHVGIEWRLIDTDCNIKHVLAKMQTLVPAEE